MPLSVIRESIHAVNADHECFADEIAIDFPSVGHLVERERDTFLGEQAGGDTLSTEVALSMRDAARGTVVPIVVPLRGTCALCGGRGETWPEPCASCSGTGESRVNRLVRLAVPPGVSHGARLRFRVSAPQAAPVRVEVRVAVQRPAA